MQTYYEKFMDKNKDRINARVLDPQGLLTENGCGVEGVYLISYVNSTLGIDLPAYVGQAGAVANSPAYIASDVYERMLQHCKRFFGGYYTYWTGLEDTDDWKIRIELLLEEPDHKKRLAAEVNYIEQLKPLLQDTQNGKFSLYTSKEYYFRNDLCIHPWRITYKGETMGQRRAAFLARFAEMQKAV